MGLAANAAKPGSRVWLWSAVGVVAGLAWAGGAHRWIQAGLALALALPVQQPGALQEFVVTLAEVLSGMLGFTLSVVAIVVQLSADRFTPKVTELFLREKTNFYLFSFLILANVVSLWSSVALGFYEDPQLLIGLNLLLGTASFLVLIPYFSFVFHFLQPTSIIRRIEQQVQQAILGAPDGNSDSPLPYNLALPPISAASRPWMKSKVLPSAPCANGRRSSSWKPWIA